MALPETSLQRYDGVYLFSSQSNSAKFTFRIDGGMGEYLNANPDDYKNQFPPMRGEVRDTIGGGKIVQEFGQYDHDREITFSQFLTKLEYEDLLSAKALRATWTFIDYLGDTWIVKFAPSDGMQQAYKIRANDKTLINFKFLVISSV